MCGQTVVLREGAKSEEGPFLFDRSSMMMNNGLAGCACLACVCLACVHRVFACQVCVLCCFSEWGWVCLSIAVAGVWRRMMLDCWVGCCLHSRAHRRRAGFHHHHWRFPERKRLRSRSATRVSLLRPSRVGSCLLRSGLVGSLVGVSMWAQAAWSVPSVLALRVSASCQSVPGSGTKNQTWANQLPHCFQCSVETVFDLGRRWEGA